MRNRFLAVPVVKMDSFITVNIEQDIAALTRPQGIPVQEVYSGASTFLTLSISALLFSVSVAVLICLFIFLRHCLCVSV